MWDHFQTTKKSKKHKSTQKTLAILEEANLFKSYSELKKMKN